MITSKTFPLYIAVGLMGLGFLCMPGVTRAAQVTFQTVPATASDAGTTVVDVFIDPQQNVLNAVDGTIGFQGMASGTVAVAVDTTGSVLTLWPMPPNYLAAGEGVRFTGGVPGGFSQKSLLFQMSLSSPVSGNVTISWASGLAYRNDGQGTEEPISAESITVPVGQPTQVTTSGQPAGPSFPAARALNDILIVLLVGILCFVLFYGYAKYFKK